MEVGIVIAFYIFVLLYSVILHEVAHGVAALWLGDHTAQNEGRLTLEPLPHIDPIGSILLPIAMITTTGYAFGWARPVPYNPYALRFPQWGPVLVALAGPATNFVIAVFGVVLGILIPLAAEVKFSITQAIVTVSWERTAELVAGDVSAIFFAVAVMIVFWNVLLGLFNLLPIPPLDGSKLLYALAPIPQRTQIFLEQWGFLILIGLIFLTPLGQLFYGVVQGAWGVLFDMIIAG